MELALDILLDALIDTAKLVPFLFVTYWAMEALEHVAGDRAQHVVEHAGAAGPLVGALVGAFPQCGFSAAASTLYAGRVITLGTLFAVFLATSDEMLPIFIAEQVDPALMFKILGLKVVVGMLMGFVVDAVMRLAQRFQKDDLNIHALCEQDHCGCHDEHGSVLRSALKHTVQVTLFIFLISLLLGASIEIIGEDVFAGFIEANPTFSVLASAVVGLIPNCAASVIITELYLEGTLGFGAMMSGLLVSAGIGLLVLLRANRHPKQNLAIIAVLFAIGVLWGLAFQATGFAL